jgi:transposase
MLSLPPSVMISVCAEPVDMRKQFDGLAALVGDRLGEDPLSGHLYVFYNRAANRLKILWWDRGGYALLYKRLERGCFVFPRRVKAGACSVRIDAGELALILEGIDLRQATWRTRWNPVEPGESVTA